MTKNALSGLANRYDLTARRAPALLSVLPAVALTPTWMPEAWAALSWGGSLLLAAGATVLLSEVARDRGRALQDRHAHRIGPSTTVSMMRHPDQHISADKKARWYGALRAHGVQIPTAAEEAKDPTAAGAAFEAAAAWLRAKTRDTKRFPVVFAENIAFGFRRNLLGMKPVGLTISAAAAVVGAALLWRSWPTTNLRFQVGALVEGVTVLGLLAWLFIVNLAFVERASVCYAEQLLGATDAIPLPGKARKPKHVA